MQTIDQQAANNTLPIAKTFNVILVAIVNSVRATQELDLPEGYEINELNRAYVLLANELEELYNQNRELSEIVPEPVWKHYDTLKVTTGRILDYLDKPENDKGQAHIARLERLCIIADTETPEFTPEQLKLVQYTLECIQRYTDKIDDIKFDEAEKVKDSWYIAEYTLDYELDGSILINRVLKLKKAHIGSTIDQLLEQAIKNQDVIFPPNLPHTARNLSTILSSAGFTPVLRQLFFPIADKSKGVLFRSTVTFEEATNDGIETTELDLLLKMLGARLSYYA